MSVLDSAPSVLNRVIKEKASLKLSTVGTEHAAELRLYRILAFNALS